MKMQIADQEKAFQNGQWVVVGTAKEPQHPLTEREVEVTCCVARAMTAKEIAVALKISVKTVDRHKANIRHKLRLNSQAELMLYAIRNGLVEA